MSGQVVTAIREAFKRITLERSFFRCLEKVEIISAGDGNLKAELKLERDHCNLYGTMAGGMACTLADMVTAFAVMTEAKDPNDRVIGGVSIKIDVTYMSPARVGETIIIDCSTLRAGKNIQYINMDIFEKETGRLVCRGQHVHKSTIKGVIKDCVM